MKYIKYLLNFIIAILFVSTCNLSPKDPGEVVLGFNKHLEKGDFKKAYKLISKRDKEYADLEYFKTRFLVPSQTLSNSKYFIKKTKIDDEKAVITLNIKGPNWSEAFLDALFKDNGDSKSEDIIKRSIEIMKSSDVKQADLDIHFNMVKENGIWKILLDFKKEDEIRNKLLKAVEFIKVNDFKSAEENINSVLAIDSSNIIANRYLSFIKRKLNEKKQ